MKRIPLTQGKFAIVDDDDFARFGMFKWHFKTNRDIGGYAQRNLGKRTDIGGRKIIRLHREIMGSPNGLEIDHINGNTLDNRKINLRVCTSQQNQFNKKKQNNTSSKFKGVDWHKRSRKWRARISFCEQTYHLGLFVSQKKAALAYNQAALQKFKEFAHTNQI